MNRDQDIAAVCGGLAQRIADKSHVRALHPDDIAGMLDELVHQFVDPANDAFTAAEEASEVHAELSAALAGLAEERLRPCSHGCPGHFGPKASELFIDGLRRYSAMTTEVQE